MLGKPGLAPPWRGCVTAAVIDRRYRRVCSLRVTNRFPASDFLRATSAKRLRTNRSLAKHKECQDELYFQNFSKQAIFGENAAFNVFAADLPNMKEKLSWFAKYQRQKENRMKKLLPGKALAKEFMKPRGLTPDQLAEEIGVPARHMNEIVQGKRAITFKILFRLLRYLGGPALEWLPTLINLYDIERSESLDKGLSAEVESSAARYKWRLAELKRSAVHDKSLLPELKRSAAHYKSLLGEVKQFAADDKWLSAELEKFYALAAMRLRALLRSSA
jgi:addiction module HigA family antidote